MSEIFFNLIFFYYSNIYFRRIFQRHLKLTLNVNYEKQPNRYTSVVPPHCRFDCRKKRCYNVTFDKKKMILIIRISHGPHYRLQMIIASTVHENQRPASYMTTE